VSESHNNPLEQFQVVKHVPLELFGYDISFSNASLFMCLAVLGVIAFMSLGTRKAQMIPGRFQVLVEMIYQFIADMVQENAGAEGKKFFPVIFSIFMFLLFANLIGLVPFSFAVTSHIVVTFAIAAFAFIGVTCVGFYKHGLHFLHFFVPKGLPAGIGGLTIAAFMIVIEFFSYLARPISLSIRLAANITAGHTLLKVIAGFVGMGIIGIFPFAFLLIFTGFELFIACLQAYIFALLCSVYLHDALHMH